MNNTLPQLPQGIPDPGPPPTPMKTLSRWDLFLGSIAAGAITVEAMKKHYISRADIETMTRSEPLQMQRWKEAQVAGRKWAWSVFDLDEIFARLSSGTTLKDAVIETTGQDKANALYALINQDDDLFDRYKKAQETAMLSRYEEIMPIADDKSEDVLDTGGKSGRIPNNAAVARSKLRVDSRFRSAGILYSKLFGERKDQVNVQVNINHAEQLEAARERAKSRDKPKSLPSGRQVIEAVFSETPSVPAADDTSWMDDKPADTVWREET